MSKRERFHGRRADLGAQGCDHPGCDQPGEFRAPRPPGKSGGTGFYVFCLEHVRAYNEQWDYFKGMTRSQIEQAAWNAYTWERPTYPRHAQAGPLPDIDDILSLFKDQPGLGRRFFDEGRKRAGGRRLSAADVDALATLGLDADAEPSAIREQYRRLVRAYHPDMNGGDRRHETKLMAVIAAYQQLHKRQAA